MDRRDPAVRIYFTGRVAVESCDRPLIDESRFPGQQGQVAFAALVLERHRWLGRDELADVIWDGELPHGWDGALSAIVSKLRRLLGEIDGGGIVVQRGAYRLRLPLDAWVDAEEATRSMEAAEAALGAADDTSAWGLANVAAAIACRPFVPGADRAWVHRQRARLVGTYRRAVDVLAEVALRRGDHESAEQLLRRALETEPFRERTLRRLMTALALAGNRAEALREYETHRALIADRLGADPSPESEALYLRLLRGEPVGSD